MCIPQPILPNVFRPPFLTRQLSDGRLTYSFVAYPIDSLPAVTNSVYAFSRRDGFILYIGSAENLPDRLMHHERIAEARNRGVTTLLVHTPTLLSYVDFREAEKRLIYAYDPNMNEMFRPKL